MVPSEFVLIGFDHFFFQWREEGHLSLRMRIPGNMWVEVWQSARSVPVRRQKRLFDETKEAEKVLGSLKSITTRADSAMNQSHLKVVTCHQRKRGKRRASHCIIRSYFSLAEKVRRDFQPITKQSDVVTKTIYLSFYLVCFAFSM